MVKLASESIVAGSSFEQVESYYKLRLPDDLQPWHDVLSKSGLLGKDSYIRLLMPAEIFEAKKGVMTPDLIPVFLDIYGNAIGWREFPGNEAGGGWAWYNHETSRLGSLGTSLKGVLRAIALALTCAAWESDLDRPACERGKDRRRDLRFQQAGALLRLAGLFDNQPQADRCAMALERGSITQRSIEYGVWALAQGVCVPMFMAVLGMREWRGGKTSEASRVWGEALADDRSSGLLHWLLGEAAAVCGDLDASVHHFANLFEGPWDNACNEFEPSIYKFSSNAGVADFSAVTAFLTRCSDKYTAVSKFRELRELLLSGGIDDASAWRETLARCLRSGNLDGARIIAINGALWPTWPDCLDKDPGYTRFCLDVLTEVYQRRGLGTRVEHLAGA